MEGKQKHLSAKHLLPEISNSPKYYTSKENSFLENKTQKASLKYQGSSFKFKSLKSNNKTFNGNTSSAKDKQQNMHQEIKSFSFKFPQLQDQKDKLISFSSNNSTIEHREFYHQIGGKKRNLFINNLQDLQKIYEQNQLNNFYSSHKILGIKDKKKKINIQNNSIEQINSVSSSPKQVKQSQKLETLSKLNKLYIYPLVKPSQREYGQSAQAEIIPQINCNKCERYNKLFSHFGFNKKPGWNL